MAKPKSLSKVLKSKVLKSKVLKSKVSKSKVSKLKVSKSKIADDQGIILLEEITKAESTEWQELLSRTPKGKISKKEFPHILKKMFEERENNEIYSEQFFDKNIKEFFNKAVSFSIDNLIKIVNYLCKKHEQSKYSNYNKVKNFQKHIEWLFEDYEFSFLH